MPMTEEVKKKFEDLHYNGTPEVLYDGVVKMLRDGMRYIDVIDDIISALSVDQLEDLIQAHCDGPDVPTATQDE